MNKQTLYFPGALFLCLMLAGCPAGLDLDVHEPWGNKTGTETRSAQGFGGSVSVTLTMDSGIITDVKISGPNESVGYGLSAIEQAPELIKEKNSFEIDTLSGATLTTNAIKDAGKAALEAIQ
jgi:uncharacterized protein with FMN-binding domain